MAGGARANGKSRAAAGQRRARAVGGPAACRWCPVVAGLGAEGRKILQVAGAAARSWVVPTWLRMTWDAEKMSVSFHVCTAAWMAGEGAQRLS